MSHRRDAMSTAHQAQLEDLVHRNRTLDQTIKRLQQELDREQTRAANAITAINTRSSRERAEWRAGCDTLIACYTIEHLRTTAALDAQRVVVVKAALSARKDDIARLQREYRLTLFQIRDSDLEARIAELEDQLEELEADNRSLQQQMAASQADVSIQLSTAQRARADLEEQHAQALRDLANLRTSVESTSSKLERTSLQLDGAQATAAELKRANEDLKRTNADLRRQLEKWQTLDTKGVAEVEDQRRRRIELEVHAKTLEARISEADKRGMEISAELGKERRTVEKLRTKLAEWKQSAEEARDGEEKHRTEALQASKKMENQQKLIEKLKADLEAERTRMKRPSPAKPNAREIHTRERQEAPEATASSEDEVLQEVVTRSSPVPVPGPTAAKARAVPKPKRAAKGRATSDAEASTSGYEVNSRAPRGRGKGKSKAAPASSEEGEPAIIEIPSKPAAKGKPKAARGKGKGKALDDDEESREAKTVTSKGKRKAKRDEDADDDRPHERTDAKGSRGESVQSGQASTANAAGETAPRKKKRTINLFGSAQDMTFEWGQLSQGDNIGSLGIPTTLSPVKESDTIPDRSASFLGRMGSVIGSFRR